MKEFTRHLIDCIVGWLIAFMTAAILLKGNFTWWDILVTFMAAGIPVLIKLREYNLSKLNKKGCIQMQTMFF